MITTAHLAEATSTASRTGYIPTAPHQAARKAVAAASHRKATVGHAPMAGVKLIKIRMPKINFSRLLPSEKTMIRFTLVCVAFALLLEILVAAGVKYNTFVNPGDKGWIFGTEKTFFGVEHYDGNREFMLCIDDHVIFGGSCG
jgi:hypothetical protein